MFLTTSKAPYDTLIEFLHQTGTQYIDTGIKPNGKSVVATIDAKLNVLDIQQRFFGVSSDSDNGGFSFDCYVNGGGLWASACKDGNGNWQKNKAGKKATKDRVWVSLSADEIKKHSLFIKNHCYPITKG